MNNILKNIKLNFKKATIAHQLIYINISLFLLINIVQVFSFLFLINIEPIFNKFLLPANNEILKTQPWTLITYMFLHNGFFHLLFNMLWLYFGGKIFLQHLNAKQLLNTYIWGGITGGLLFIIAYNYIPALQHNSSHALALGASASVLAIVVAIATYIPKYIVILPFIGKINLKNIAIACVILDILSIPNGNAGGHIAHLGGASFGFIYIKQLKNNLLFSFDKILHKINPFGENINKQKKRYKNYKNDYIFNRERTKQNKKIDSILDKIAKSGYKSLDKKEKELLFKASKK